MLFSAFASSVLLFSLHKLICYVAEHPKVCQVRLLPEIQLMWQHSFICRYLSLHINSCLDCFGPIELRHMLLLEHCSCHFLYQPILPLGHVVLLWCVSAREFAPNSFLPQIIRELVEKVLFPAIKPKAVDFFVCLPFGKALNFQEIGKDFAILLDQARSSV